MDAGYRTFYILKCTHYYTTTITTFLILIFGKLGKNQIVFQTNLIIIRLGLVSGSQ